MLRRLINAFTPSANPSALLVLSGSSSTIHVLHLLPDNNINERFSLTASSSATAAFHHSGATEQAREQIGTVTLYVGDGETAESFLDEVEIRIRKQQDSVSGLSQAHAQEQGGTISVTQLVNEAICPAAIDAIHEREKRERSMNATQAFSVFIIYIRRSRPGAILKEPTTSFA